ncbi:glyoxylate reductase [Rhodococcus sp. 27YEA15]|uniref:2-hydroxyacid dehydrogenase n=1 Tax=Rhodococcus sp. 27YEA15 TaxID=3156259 RepID=UPI003C7A7AB9
MARILLTRPLPPGGDKPLTTTEHEIVRLPDDNLGHADLVELARNVDAIVCVLSDRIDRDVLEAGRGRLRAVATVSVGHDNIDVDYATRSGVTVCNTPGVLDEATADIAFLLLLSAARQASEAERVLRSQQWEGWGLTQFLGKDLRDASLGLVGYGRIGQAVARRAEPFGLVVRHHTRTDTGIPGWTADLDDILATSDFVSLHVPLNRYTHHLIDRDRLRQMKPGAVLVNTARGPIVDEDALAEALESGHIFAAGLDVFEREPEINSRLLAAPGTVLLPHIGSATEGTRRKMAQMACSGVISVLAGEQPAHRVLVQSP